MNISTVNQTQLRLEEEKRQMGRITEYCHKNSASMRIKPMRSNLDHLKCKFPGIEPDLILKAYRMWAKNV